MQKDIVTLKKKRYQRDILVQELNGNTLTTQLSKLRFEHMLFP